MIHNVLTGHCSIAEMFPDICRQTAVEMNRENLDCFLQTNELSTAYTLLRQNILLDVCLKLLQLKNKTAETQTDPIEQEIENFQNADDFQENLE
jgi:hypothetical protein